MVKQSGVKSDNSSTKDKTENSGNFKNNPGRASEAGRKGGENSHGGRKS